MRALRASYTCFKLSLESGFSPFEHYKDKGQSLNKLIQSGLVVSLALLAFSVSAQEGGDASELPVEPIEPVRQDRVYQEPTFVLSGFKVEGPELIGRKRIFEVLAGFSGRPITFSELRQATQAVEKLHGLAGFEVVRVIIPEQELKENAELTLQILDARLDQITVKGNEFFSSEQIAREMTVLEPGVLLNTRDMDRNLRLLNDNAARTVRVSLEPSEKPGLVDAIVNVSDEKPVSGFVTLDNTGTNATGDFRLGAVVQHNNLFEKGHSASFQMVTSPGHWSDVKVFGASYRIPLYGFDSFVEYSINDSTVNAGSLAIGGTSLTINGAGTQQALKFTHLFDRSGGYDRRLALSLEDKKFVSNVQIAGAGASLVPNTASRPVGVVYSAMLEEPEVQRSFSIGYYRNYFFGGENTTAQYQLANVNADVSFDMIKFNASWSGLLLPTWRYTAKLDGQFTDFSLISGEQFGAGGVYSVRGFEERVLSGDSGLRQSLELMGPDWSKKLPFSLERLRMVFFAEAAQVRLNAGFNTAIEPHIASFGAGLRFAFLPEQQINLDLAKVVSGVNNQPHGDVMLHFSFATAL